MFKMTYNEMLEQLRKICAYYFFEKDFDENMIQILNKFSDLNADEFAKKYESKTDEFIHKIANHVDGNRGESIKLINHAPEEILATLIYRLMTFVSYCNENPQKQYTLLEGTNSQLVIECLINFWHHYNQESPLI